MWRCPPILEIEPDSALEYGLREEKKGFARKHFSEELHSSIITWKEDRSDLVHALMKQSLHTEDLKGLAEQGQALIKELSGKVKSYNRAIDRITETGG